MTQVRGIRYDFFTGQSPNAHTKRAGHLFECMIPRKVSTQAPGENSPPVSPLRPLPLRTPIVRSDRTTTGQTPIVVGRLRKKVEKPFRGVDRHPPAAHVDDEHHGHQRPRLEFEQVVGRVGHHGHTTAVRPADRRRRPRHPIRSCTYMPSSLSAGSGSASNGGVDVRLRSGAVGDAVEVHQPASARRPCGLHGEPRAAGPATVHRPQRVRCDR